jgi:hypothetical protein
VSGLEGVITEESVGIEFNRTKNNKYLSVILVAEIVAYLYNNLCDNLVPEWPCESKICLPVH